MSKRKKLLQKICAIAIVASMLASSVLTGLGTYVGTNINVNAATSSSKETPASSFEYEEFEDGDITVTITKFVGGETDVVIPSQINGYPVVGIAPHAFDNFTNITSITIPESVVEIEGYVMGRYTTEDYITGDVFDGCTNLKEINVNENNEYYSSVNGVLFNKNKTSLIKYPMGKTNSKYSVLKNVISIEYGAFSNCTNLKSVSIPNGVNNIEEFAFSGCTNLNNITIPVSVTSIGYSAFDDTAWYDNQPYGLVYAGKVAYKYKGEMPENTEIILKDGTIGIADSAFSDCSNLIDIKISNSVTNIGDDAFSYCTNLTNIIIPESVKIIERGTFSHCKNLNNIVIPDSVTSIKKSAFYACRNLKNVIIGNSVRTIENNAFYNCTNLINIKIPESVKYIGWNTFYNCDNLTIHGYMESYTETYANDNNIPFVIISQKILTNKVGNIAVDGVFDDGAMIYVEKATVENAAIAYNIILIDENGNAIQPMGKITVTIPSKNRNCKVYWIKDDGTKVDMNATYKNGNYEFTTDHLSVYALIESSLLGDTNGDNKVNIADALMIARYDAKLVTLTDGRLSVSDVTGDGKVNIADALKIARYDAKLIDSL